MRFGTSTSSLLILTLIVCIAGCDNSAKSGTNVDKKKNSAGETAVLRVTGSDTMVNLAQAWAEKYMESHPEVNVEVKGGGSGVGIAALINGKVDIATASRTMKQAELDDVKKNSGKQAVETKTSLDALAIYVHPSNPIKTISIPELKGIYGEGGEVEKWADLGVDNSKCTDDMIVRVSRQNSSGTYVYFKEAVIGEKGEYKQGTLAQSGSSDVVALVSKTPCAIGYSGMGYKTDKVNFVPVSKEKGMDGVLPSIESATDGTYPISRPLFLYTAGEPQGAAKNFIDWILSADGQEVVKELGYVPLPK